MRCIIHCISSNYYEGRGALATSSAWKVISSPETIFSCLGVVGLPASRRGVEVCKESGYDSSRHTNILHGHGYPPELHVEEFPILGTGDKVRSGHLSSIRCLCIHGNENLGFNRAFTGFSPRALIISVGRDRCVRNVVDHFLW